MTEWRVATRPPVPERRDDPARSVVNGVGAQEVRRRYYEILTAAPKERWARALPAILSQDRRSHCGGDRRSVTGRGRGGREMKTMRAAKCRMPKTKDIRPCPSRVAIPRAVGTAPGCGNSRTATRRSIFHLRAKVDPIASLHPDRAAGAVGLSPSTGGDAERWLSDARGADGGRIAPTKLEADAPVGAIVLMRRRYRLRRPGFSARPIDFDPRREAEEWIREWEDLYDLSSVALQPLIAATERRFAAGSALQVALSAISASPRRLCGWAAGDQLRRASTTGPGSCGR